MTDTSKPLERSGRRGRRFLSPVQKYEAFVQVLTGEMTVAECADHWGVDRSTIMRAREVAKRGALGALASSRPGVRAEGPDPELVMARDEAAPPGRGAQGDGGEGHVVGGKRALGVTAGVPPRVEAGTKAALLDLVDGAVEAGWTTARACAVLEFDGRRCRRWQHRRGAVRLDDDTAGGTAVHAITPAERQAVLELFERWGDIDGGYRKLAHRGSYENLVWVSPSTLYRVLAGEGLVLPARPQRTPAPARPLPDWIEWKRHQIWIYDITHFPRAGRVAYAILDVVTRKWLATLVTVEETATQVEVVFTEALDTEGLWPAVEARQAQRARHGDDSDQEPILLAMSDNGPQMRAGTTREFLAMCSIASRFGRPGTPTDQAWIETLFGHVKTEWPHLEKITDPNTLRAELDIARHDYNTRRLHASLGYVTPDDEHQGRGDTIRQARRDGLNRARLTRIAYHRNNNQNQP